MTLFPATTKNQFFLLWAAVIAILMISAVVSGAFGSIGIDSDDQMRLVQIRDLYQGQSWFDLTQTRMGLDGGTLMHWSRLVDLPILCLIWFFDLFLSYDLAEQIAFTIWPPLTSGLVIWGVLVGARHAGGKLTAKFAMLLTALWLGTTYKYAPGSIDHHNLQLGLLALVIGYALDPQMRVKSYTISGAALALSVAIGVEIYIFAAILCAFFALNWWLKGEAAKSGTAAFGLSFGFTLLAIFLGTISPQNYGMIQCDAFSFVTFAIGGIGGNGLTIAAHLTSNRTIRARFICLAMIAGACLMCMVFLGPQCLDNPLNALPAEVKSIWLGTVIEAQPLFKDQSKWLSVPPYMLGAPLVAISAALWQVRQKENSAQNLCMITLLITAIGLTLYQIRFNIFGILFTLFVLPKWVGSFYEKRETATDEKSNTGLGHIAALIVSIPLFWGVPGQLIKQKTQETLPQNAPENAAQTSTAKARPECYSDAVINAVKTLPPGRFVVAANGGPLLLLETHHSVLTGNYHRNFLGIQTHILAMTQPPEMAAATLRQANVDYILFCHTNLDSLANHSQNGLGANLMEGNIPDFLLTLSDKLAGGDVTIYGVKP